jgi:hypothetical protein
MKANCDRWQEEANLLAVELERVACWFNHMQKEWGNYAHQNIAKHPGVVAYAARMSDLYGRLYARAVTYTSDTAQ